MLGYVDTIYDPLDFEPVTNVGFLESDRRLILLPENIFRHYSARGGVLSEILNYSIIRKYLTISDIISIIEFNIFSCDEDSAFSTIFHTGDLERIFNFDTDKCKIEFENSITPVILKLHCQKYTIDSSAVLVDIDKEDIDNLSFKIEPTIKSGYYVIVVKPGFFTNLKVRDFRKKFVSECLKMKVPYVGLADQESSCMYTEYLKLLQEESKN